MREKLPTPRSAFALFVLTLFLNFLLAGVLIPLSTDVGLLLVEPIAILLPTLLMVFTLRLDTRRTLRLRLPSLTDFLLALPLALSLTVLNDQLSNLTQQIFPMDESFQEKMAEFLRVSSFTEWLIKILGIGVGAAVSEEIMFRGFIQKGLERGFGRSTAILSTSLLFAAMHLIWQVLPSYVLAGIVLGITALASGSILIPIVIHLVFNTSALLLLNVAQIETLGRPVWTPAGILIPALVLFGLTLGHFLRKMSQVPEERTDTADHRFFLPEGPSRDESLSSIPLERRRLGCLAVGCAVAAGTFVILTLFTFSIYQMYSRQLNASWLRLMEEEVLASAPPTERPRVERGFEALSSINEAGNLTLSQIVRLNWLYIDASADGAISPNEMEALLDEIQSILRESSPVKRL